MRDAQPYFGRTSRYLQIPIIILVVVSAVFAVYLLFIKSSIKEVPTTRVFSYGMNNPYFLANLLNITLDNITSTAIPCTLQDYRIAMAGVQLDWKDTNFYANLIPAKEYEAEGYSFVVTTE